MTTALDFQPAPGEFAGLAPRATPSTCTGTALPLLMGAFVAFVGLVPCSQAYGQERPPASVSDDLPSNAEPPASMPPPSEEPPPPPLPGSAPPSAQAETKATSAASAPLSVPAEASVSSPATALPTDPYDAVRGFSFNSPTSDVRVRPIAELGAIFVAWHHYQGGSDGTEFDWRRDGGQASASFTWRLSAELELFARHNLILLYQPIDLRTRATLSEDLRVNGLTFPSGTPMQFRYGFDYYRLSYLYDFLADRDNELAIGLSMQLRVADLEFSSLDGKLQRTSQNLGPVPLVKLRGRYTFDNDVFLGTEIDGIAIQFPSEQGSVLGLFFDTSLRVGYSPTQFIETFLNLRYLGGGARGPGSRALSSEFGDGYNNNFIHAMTLSIGFGVK